MGRFNGIAIFGPQFNIIAIQQLLRLDSAMYCELIYDPHIIQRDYKK